MKVPKSLKGFTLIELMVVIIIIGVLASISVPIYKSYIARARSAEGTALLGAVASAQRIYFAEHGTYSTLTANLGIDATRNSYFTTYVIDSANAAGFTVHTDGIGEAAGVKVTLVQGAAGGPVITVTGL